MLYYIEFPFEKSCPFTYKNNIVQIYVFLLKLDVNLYEKIGQIAYLMKC